MLPSFMWHCPGRQGTNHDVPPVLHTVSLQGLQIYSPAGELVFERQMDADVATQAIQVAVQEGLTHVAYCGTRM